MGLMLFGLLFFVLQLPIELRFHTTKASMSNSLSGPSNFADDGSTVIARQLEVHHSRLASGAQNKIKECSDIYEIERTISVITERGYKRVRYL